ncbi:MAG: thiamine pyrophosphate-binding protein [Chloroflexi bacterium]|nr:thiamine pyrophosphate-binding protein [Chloroflexota bacterium]
MTTVATTTAAQATAAELKALGAEHLFLMTGRDNTLWIALQAAGIRQVLARTEAAAVYMADGYARVTGRPTFVYGAYGPGAANVAGALAEPFWSTSPVIAMASTMRRLDRFRSEYQELDQAPLFQSVTKWGVEAATASQVPRFIREAARRSLAGTPGPVYLGIPGDVYEDELSGYREPEAADRPLELPLTRPAPTETDVAAIVESVARASRPILLVGNGVHQSGGYDELQLLAERLRIPVVTSLAGKGAIPETHPLALGTVGRYSRRYANEALAAADLVLAVGTALGGLVTNSYKLIKPGVELIHVAIDPDVLGQNFSTQRAVLADARTFLAMAVAAADRLVASTSPNGRHRSNGHRPRNGHRARSTSTQGRVGGEQRDAYLAELAEHRSAWHARRIELASQDGTDGRPMRPEALLGAVDELMADDAIVCADTGYASAWPGGLLELRRAGRHFFRADGSLGWAFAGAMGAKMAAPGRQVIAVIGDGGFGYQVADIETAVRLGLPTVTIILNNGTLAFEAHVQTLLYDHLVPEVDDFLDVDYGAVARAFGAVGVRVTNAPDARRALAAALRSDRPTVIDAVIDRDAIAPVTRYDAVRSREL